MGSTGHGPTAIPEIDVLLVGAGFGAFSLWKKLHNLNLNLTVKIYERAPSSGGIWYWNNYPGARVDSDSPTYQLFERDLYSTFQFKERYAGGKELREYFKHVEKTWNISQDIAYNKEVAEARFDEANHMWRVKCTDGSEVYCRWFVPCLGIASKRYLPDFPGIESFKGDIYHTGEWPQHDVNLAGKKVAVIGTGASGVQVIQEIGDQVAHLTVYQRTPNLCLPMRNAPLDPKLEQEKINSGKYDEIFATCRTTYSGFPRKVLDRDTFDDTPEEQEAVYQSLWDEGGFGLWLSPYRDMLKDPKANDVAYHFWRKQVLKRIKTPYKAALLAPQTPPHPWGTKRPSLEQRFYEVIDQPHIDIIHLPSSPITAITPAGIITATEGLVEVDTIILATGFDIAATISTITIVGYRPEHTVSAHWATGIATSLGIAVPGFPNMLFLYGPHAPTAFSNGPSILQYQAEWVAAVVGRAKGEGVTWFEAREEMEGWWKGELRREWEATLFPLAKSWYQGANVPWRKTEVNFWVGGNVKYMETLWDSLEDQYKSWITTKAPGGDRRN